MKKLLFSAAFLLSQLFCFSQTDVRAWYADGQVFVVWKIGLPIEQTYAIYASPNAFSNTANATLVGRPFHLEYLGYSLKENLQDTTATYRIPDGQGGEYQLAMNEGLFVFTPHQSGALYFAVTKWGSSTVTPGQNITANAVPFVYNPVGDPVECHLQRLFPSPFTSGYVCLAYCLWVDGRQNEWESRADFPVMANAAKNGMPGLFMVSAPLNLDTTKAFPLSVWLHGGGGIARQSLAGSRQEIGINPVEGILLAHDDKMYGYRGTLGPYIDEPTWHFGWGKKYDPFTPNNPLINDTIINYTQRRYLWVDSWLAKHFNIDTTRINIHGHSMGSAGTLGMLKSFPEHYGSGTIFNTGCAGPTDTASTIYIFGTKSDNLPTSLKNRNNEPVQLFSLWDLYSNCSKHRDLPLLRHWHGKNDDNNTMHWSPEVVRNFNICDSIGTGIQDSWSERPHGVDLAPDYNDHWIMGPQASQQTVVDNVAFAESRYRSNASFPAFFNHRLDARNNDPGSGLIGIDNGDGDNWGTWGGYHRWENVLETPQSWQVTAWLESDAVFANDNSPENFLLADLAIRRPQTFLPGSGQPISWKVKDQASGNVLKSGTTSVQADNLVVIPQVAVFRKDIRKVIISITLGNTPTEEVVSGRDTIRISPNPTNGVLIADQDWVMVRIFDVNGIEKMRLNVGQSGQILDVSGLTAGLYFVQVLTDHETAKMGRMLKL